MDAATNTEEWANAQEYGCYACFGRSEAEKIYSYGNMNYWMCERHYRSWLAVDLPYIYRDLYATS